jgi:hypothetical protein
MTIPEKGGLSMRVCALAFTLVLFAGGAARAEDQPRLDFQTRISAPKGAAFLMEQVCLPVIVDGKPIEEAVNNRDLLSLSAKRAGVKSGTDQDRSWMINGTERAQVTAWADGTCMVGLREGKTDQILEAVTPLLKARGFVQGQTSADGDVIRTEHCLQTPAATFVVSIKTPAPTARREPFVANVFRSKSLTKPSYCVAG